MSKKRRKLYQKGRGSELGNKDLKVLTSLTKKALSIPHILQAIEILKIEILESKEPFVWKGLSAQLLGETFPIRFGLGGYLY
ncbi:MAG: hypothetical protein QXM52_01605 [Candidatus Bathyarchaeia archaeon]